MICWQEPSTIRPFGRQSIPDSLLELFHETTKLTTYDMPTQAVRAFRQGDMVTSRYRNALSFKFFAENERIRLPEPQQTKIAFGRTLRRRRSCRTFAPKPLSLQALANTVLPALARSRCPYRRWRVDGLFRFGTYPSGGGLFPIEHYLIALNVETLNGVIAYVDSRESALVIQKRGVTSAAIEAVFSAKPGWLEQVACVIVQTACLERSTVKYGPRGYRLALLEAGHAGQNLLLTAAAQNLGALPWAGFLDDPLAELLNVDPIDEPVISTILIGHQARRTWSTA